MGVLRRVAVYCGSNSGAHPDYVAAAEALGALLVERGLGLVYGGARVGTMGAIADAVLARGGEVIGVIPRGLVDLEVAHQGLSELIVVNTLHERKAQMTAGADASITLPGGFGSHDELFEALTWLQLGVHDSPVGLLNVRGYYDGLVAHLDHAVREGFLRPEVRALLHVEQDAAALLDALAGFTPPPRPAWTRGA